MKPSRRSTLLQSGLLALALAAVVYLAWQRYSRPTPRAYDGKTLEQWVEDLDDSDYRISDRAAEVLASAGTDALPVLLAACEQGDVHLHRRAVALLVRLGAPAAPGLAAVLKDKGQAPSVEVALVRLGSAAVPALCEALAEEKSSETAAHILGLIGPRAAAAVPELIAVLNRRQASTALRGEAAFALGRIGVPPGEDRRDAGSADSTDLGKDIFAALIAALRDSKKEVRQQAAEALSWIGPPAREAVPALSAALKDEDAKAAQRACQALAFIGDGAAAPALVEAVQDKRGEVAVEAGRVLWFLGKKSEPVLPALLSAAQGPLDKSAPIRGLLAAFGPRVTPELRTALHSNDAARREAAADILGRIGPPARAAVPDLFAALKDKVSSRAALMAAMALTEIDPTRGAPAVPILLDSLDVPGAAAALANLGPDARAAVPALIAALKPRKGTAHPELIRFNARLALARIGTPAVPALIEALKDKSEGVAPLAGEALGWILPPSKRAVPALRAALRSDRAHAAIYAHSLGLLGPPAEPAAPDLVDLLTDTASRAEAAVALVRIDPKLAGKALPPLIKDLQGDDEKPRQAAVSALARLGDAARPAADALVTLLRDRLLSKMEIEALGEVWAHAIPGLAELLKDPQTEIRQHAVLALGQIGPAARAALGPLIAALSDRDSTVRIDVAQVLQGLGTIASEAAPALIVNLQNRRMEVRATAAAALGHIEGGAKEALRPLVECLFDPDEHVRYAAALSLGRIDPHYTAAIPALRDALNDSAPMVQLGAIDSLSRIEPASSKETGPILLALSRQPNLMEVRFRAVEGLTNIRGAEAARQAVPWLTIELTDIIPENCLYAARLLANIQRDQTSPLVLALATLLRTPLPKVRTTILKTLAEFGVKAREVVPEIERLLYDGAPGVRPEAIRALRVINPVRLKQLGLE